jgi:hypothetical protein
MAVQQARSDGIVVPEYTTDGTAAVVYYGDVPEGFTPNVPPPKAVREKLAEKSIHEIWPAAGLMDTQLS